MYIPDNIRQSAFQYALGSYLIHPAHTNNEALETWIKDLQFEQYELPENRLQQHSRKRNNLYTFYLPVIDKEVVLKVSQTSAHYRWYRKLNLLLTDLVKNYSLSAYYGSIALENIGVESIKTLAHWASKRQGQSVKSYLLYEKIPATMSAYDLCNQLHENNPNAADVIQKITEKLAATIRKIHANNIRHGDPHAGNFLLSSTIHSVEQLTAESVAQMSFALIDLDKIEFGNNENTWLKKIRNIRCLRRFRVHNIEGTDALRYYLEKSPSLLDKTILKFWMMGGFNFYKWLKPSQKRN